jgi:hypothetical protein
LILEILHNLSTKIVKFAGIHDTLHNISNEDLSRLLVLGSEWESLLSAKEYVREYCFSVKKSVMMRNRGKKQNTREAQRADRRVLRAQ